MPDSLSSLYQTLKSRPSDHIVGWRAGAVVHNAQFLQRLSAWHSLLRRTPGRNFALYVDDSIEFAAALLGAWHAGKTVWLTADTLATSNASLKLSIDGFLGEFPPELAPLEPRAELGRNDNDPEISKLDSNFTALVVHTSGTTGAAQAVPKRLSQLSIEVTTLEVLFGAILGDADVVATVSQQHIYGLLFRVLWPLVSGRAMHARSQNFPEELAQVLALRPSVLIASPAHLKRLPKHLDWSGANHCLRAIFSSGGPLPADVAHAGGELLGKVPIEIYGSSETGGVAWRQRSASSDESWLAFPKVEWRVSAEENLLEVRSPHLSEPGWLRVADRIEARGDGRFMLHGRSDRIVKIEEKRVSLDAIERIIADSPLVAAVRLAVCDEAPGQRQQLAAFVVASEPGQALLVNEGKLALNRCLRELLIGRIAPVAHPRRWRYLDQMPVNAQGKITRAALLALLDARPREPQLRLIESDALKVKLEMCVPVDLFYFDGHFPGAPILPGVVQVDWAIANARRHFALPPHFHALTALKFQHVIRPGNVVFLDMTHDPVKDSVSFRYASALGQHASGQILFRDTYL